MAGSKVIRIILESITGDVGGSEATGEETPEIVYQKEHRKAIKNAVSQSVSWAFNEIEAASNYSIGKYVSLTENYKTNVWISNVSTTISKAKGLVSYTMTGAKLGAAIGGTAGTAVGVAVGAVVSVASTSFDLMRQYTTQSISLVTGDISAGYAASRLGLVDGGRGTQN